MRHTLLCLIVAFLTATACFVLIPTIGLLLLYLFRPGILNDDTLSLMWAFFALVWPALLAQLSGIAILAGFVAFLMAKAKLPDRGWRSGQTLAILAMFATTLAAAAVMAWPHFETPPEIGPQQTGLPTLHLARTLKGAGARSAISGPVRLAWSTDGERLAAYGGAGIITWSPDGKYQKEFSLFRSFPLQDDLHYLSGHRLLLTSPVAEVNSPEERRRLEDIAFSVFDTETGKVLQDVPGPHPGGRAVDDRARDLAVSSDERLVAAVCGWRKPQINIYSTKDWKPVTTIDVGADERGDARRPSGLAFSPDGERLAVWSWDARITFFEVGSWAPSGSLAPYADASRSGFVGVGPVAFSPDQTMIAVGSTSGGTWWKYPPGRIMLPGSGAFKQEFPADPLRVFRVSGGRRVASLGSFPGGLSRSGLVWSPDGRYLAFYDALGAIRFWDPLRPDLSVVTARGGNRYGSLLFSKDGSQMAANFPDGVRVFDVIPPR